MKPFRYLFLLLVMALPVGSALAADAAMIRNVQQNLATLGYEPGPADGVPGNRTLQAVKQFRQDHGLTVNTSITSALQRLISNEVAKRQYEQARSGASETTATASPASAAAPAQQAPAPKVETRYQPESAPAPAQQGSNGGGFFGGLADFSRRITGGLGGGNRSYSDANQKSTATIGIRGLGASELKTAQPNPRAMQMLNSFRIPANNAYRYADDQRLSHRDVDYLQEGGSDEEEKGGIGSWFQ